MSRALPSAVESLDLSPMANAPIALRYFVLYLEMGEERSLAALAVSVNRSYSQVRNLASQYQWPALINQYELALARLAAARHEDERLRAFERARVQRLTTARIARYAGLRALRRALATNDIGANAAVALLQFAANEERKDLGSLQESLKTRAAQDPLAAFRALAPAKLTVLVDLLKEVDLDPGAPPAILDLEPA